MLYKITAIWEIAGILYTAMTDNVVAENLFAKVYQEGNIFVLIESILDTRTNGTKILQQDAFIIINSGTKQIKIQLKDGKSASNGRMTVLHGTNLNISSICIQYE